MPNAYTAKQGTTQAASETAEIKLPQPISFQDVALIGLALVRLEEAAEDFIFSYGEDESETFPLLGESGAERVARVQHCRESCQRLYKMFFDVQQRVAAEFALQKLHGIMEQIRQECMN